MNPVLSNDYFLTTVKCGATGASKIDVDASGACGGTAAL